MSRRTIMGGRLLAVVLLTVVLCAGNAWGKVIYVDDDAPAPGDGASWVTAYRYLQDALTAAATADDPVEIRVAQGTYKPDRSSMHPEGTGDMTAVFLLTDGMSLLCGYAGIAGADPNQRDFKFHETILSGDLADNDAEVGDVTLLRNDITRDENTREVVCITGDHVLLEGGTILGGTRGGVQIFASDVIVRDCLFRGNRGNEVDAQPSAGGLTAYGDGLLVSRCSFIGNAGYMGAARADGQSFAGCFFATNYSWGSGGGAGWHGGATFTDCVFVDNRARGNGGALCLRYGDSVLTRCLFRGNVAEKGGGALICLGATTIVNCVFVANEAIGGGGGLEQSNSLLTMSNCLFVGNRGGREGGAMIKGSVGATIDSCTFADNRATNGAFFYRSAQSGLVEISNCVISNGGNEIWNEGVSSIMLEHTNVVGGKGAIGDPSGLVIWGEGNVDADPLFFDPGYWDANGTPDDPNDDFFVEGDYHLKSQAGRWDPASRSWVQDDATSPCIDAGDPNDRIGDEPFPNGGIINMGAYGGTAQASKSYFSQSLCQTIITGDLNGDCIVDWTDLAILVRHWLETGTPESE